MKPVRFAIVGCGKIGNRHAEKLKSVEGAVLDSVFDVEPERAKQLAQMYHCSFYTDVNELLKKGVIDYVNICTPSGLHPENTIQALRAGKHVLCEKPMAFSEQDAQNMVQAAHENNRHLFVVNQNRYNPPVEFVKKLAKDGILGKPLKCVVNMYWNRGDEYYKTEPWRGKTALDGGLIYSQASHFIDLWFMFMGKPKKIYSLMGTKAHNIEIEDTGVVVTEFENGAFGSFNYTINATKQNFEGSITLFYTNGTIKIGGEFLNTIEVFQVPGMEDMPILGEKMESARGSASKHDLIFKALVALENKDEKSQNLIENLIPGEEGAQVVRFMEKIVESAKTGLPVTF